ncbi:MAG: sigma-54 dependent transcriptional regulator [Acidobacteriota bacterium]
MSHSQAGPQGEDDGRPKALVVEDDESTLQALAALVECEGFATRIARDLATARRAIEQWEPDLVLADLYLPDGQGTELLDGVRENPSLEIIMVTGDASVATAVEALRLGAYDYLIKPIDEARLLSLLASFGRTQDLKTEILDLRGALRQLGRFGSMVGESTAMQKLYDLLEKVAPTDATVLVVGESGTGKELAAETVHHLSRRRQEPFIAVNCGAVAATLIESELFGHERGAFTGAERLHRGYFEQAHGGTLFLDEVTEMAPELQVKLLRVLETSRVTRVGSTEPIDIDVRIVGATNRDPEQAVADGELRQDLYYRLNVFPIHVPPLRARSGDVTLLAKHFLDQHAEESGRKVAFTGAALEALDAHPWPGNVRELRNAVQRAFIVAEGQVDVDCLPAEVQSGRAPRFSNGLELRPGMSVAEAERKLIEITLESLDGDKKEAADLLGISLKTLYNRLNAYAE